MNRTALVTLPLLLASSLLAADAPQKAPVKTPTELLIERQVNEALPVCGDTKVERVEVQHKLPPNLVGKTVRVASSRPACEGQYIQIMSNQGGIFLGTPWFLEGQEGKTIEERLKNFSWNVLHENFDATVNHQPTPDGLYPVVLYQTTERGKIPIEGEVDGFGMVFFLGHFHRLNGDYRADRAKAFEPFLADMPATGGAKPAVTIIEFSDFECPSCQRAAGYMTPILEKYGEKVRYVRFDLPLISSHPWAFAAAVAGRAVWHQKPEAFWEFKKQVYKNQDGLTAFTFDDFARNFAKDHDLNLEKYDADIISEALHAAVLKGVGAAFSNDVRSTPSYLVNGALVDPGPDAADLDKYVAAQLKK